MDSAKQWHPDILFLSGFSESIQNMKWNLEYFLVIDYIVIRCPYTCGNFLNKIWDGVVEKVVEWNDSLNTPDTLFVSVVYLGFHKGG